MSNLPFCRRSLSGTYRLLWQHHCNTLPDNGILKLRIQSMPARTNLPKICIALGFAEPEQLLEHARREVESGEQFLEFRLDYLPNPAKGADIIRAFLAECPDATVLATCRRHQNQGKYNGSIEEQIRILELAVDAGAKAVDVEIESRRA